MRVDELHPKQNSVYKSQYNSRGWAFTWNNPPKNNIDWPTQLVQYALWQREKGLRGTEHLQGVVFFKKQVKLGTVKSVLAREVHLEPVKSNKHCIEYCRKTETRILGPWEFGELPLKIANEINDEVYVGGTNEVKEVQILKEQVRLGRSYTEIYADFPFIARSHSTYLDRIIAERNTTTARPLYVLFGTGPPGVGKTSFAKAFCKANNWTYYLKDSSQWWPGYDGQQAIIWDEFTPGTAQVPLFNSLTTGDLLTVPVKGSQKKVDSEALILLSNYSLEYCFPPPQISATLNRRIDTNCQFFGDFEAVNNNLQARFTFFDTSTSPKSLIDSVHFEYLPSQLESGFTETLAKEVAARYAQRRLHQELQKTPTEKVLALPLPKSLEIPDEKPINLLETEPQLPNSVISSTATSDKRKRGRPRKAKP